MAIAAGEGVDEYEKTVGDLGVCHSGEIFTLS
jgi:hypothetical protein